MFDWIFREVEIFDGTGDASWRGDVAIEGDRIAAVGSVGQSGVHVVDGSDFAWLHRRTHA